jgi:hypothetical protein
MNNKDLLALAVTVLIVLGLVGYRRLWAASGAASAAGLGRLPILPKSWRRWLLNDHHNSHV